MLRSMAPLAIISSVRHSIATSSYEPAANEETEVPNLSSAAFVLTRDREWSLPLPTGRDFFAGMHAGPHSLLEIRQPHRPDHPSRRLR